MAWQPQEAPLRQVVGYLKDSLSPVDRVAQRNATVVSTREDAGPARRSVSFARPKLTSTHLSGWAVLRVPLMSQTTLHTYSPMGLYSVVST